MGKCEGAKMRKKVVNLQFFYYNQQFYYILCVLCSFASFALKRTLDFCPLVLDLGDEIEDGNRRQKEGNSVILRQKCESWKIMINCFAGWQYFT